MHHSPSTLRETGRGERETPDLFLFDFDGTVADTLEISHGILNQLAEEFRFRPLPREELDHVRSLGTRDFIRHLGISAWRVPRISRRGLRLLQERIAEVNPIAGMPQVLEELHGRGHRIGILTSNSETNVLAFIARHRLPYFHFVRTSSKLFGKGRAMRRILKAEGLPPERVLYVGDETRDIEAAKEAGLRMAAVGWGYNALTALSALDPDHLLEHPGELLRFRQARRMKTGTAAKLRLDQHLHEAGHFESREKAQRAILAGQVTVDGRVADKPGTKVRTDSEILITGRDRYVGRGGHKLEGAIRGFGVDPMGKICLDLGSSTGGFTDCLLQHWASHVTAVDVGRGQLAWSLRQDPRVEVREGINARYLDASDFTRKFDLIVGDLSFISLTKILPAAFELLLPEGVMIVLIKPQFELSSSEVGKGGIVRDPLARRRAVESIRSWVVAAGHRFDRVMESPLPGTTGNIEFLALLRRGYSPVPLPA